MLRIRRVEFRIAEIPILAIPILLTVRDNSILKTFDFWEGVLIFFFLFAFGDMINCLADRDLDAIYKPHLSEAVYGLGVRFVMGQVVVSGLAALALAAHLSWRRDNWTFLIMVAIGLTLGAAYSVKPVQLKSRGLSQLACLWLIIFVGPMVFVGLLVGASPSVAVIAFVGAYGTVQMGIILVNTAEDYPEDLAANISTTIVALGLHRGITLALWLVISGATGVLVTLVMLFLQRGPGLIWLVALAPVVGACLYVMLGMVELKRAIDKVSLAESIALVKRSGKRVPLWVTMVAWSTMAAAFAFFYISTARP